MNHHRLDAHHGPSGHDGQGQFDIFLQLGVLLVDRHKVEGLAVQQAGLKLKRQREHRREIRPRFGIPAGNLHKHLHVFKRVRHHHLHRHALAFRHVQFRGSEPHDHGAQPSARGFVLSQEVEGVLGVHIPFRLSLRPVGGALADVGFPNQRVLRHAARLHRPTVGLAGVILRANLSHLVNHHPILPKHNGVVAVEPSHRAQHLALAHNGRVRLRVPHHMNPSWKNGAFEVELLRRRGGAVVVDLHGVRGQINRFNRGVVHLERLVVAGAFDVLADDQIVAQARLATLQDVHLKEVAAQAVAAISLGVVHPRPCHDGAVHQAVLVAQPPHVVVSRFLKSGKIEVGLVGGGQHEVFGVANQKHVFVFCGVAEVPERHQRAILRQQARLGVWLCARREDGAAIARGDFTGLALQGDNLVRQADAPARLRRANVRQGGRGGVQDGVVRHRHHVVAAVAQSLHVDGGAQEHLHHHVRARLQNHQARGRGCRVRGVCEPHNLGAQVGAERGDAAVQRQVSPFAPQHVGRARAEGLHHELLVQGRAAIRHARQAVRTRVHTLSSFVNRGGGVGVHHPCNRRHLRVGDRRVAVEHCIRDVGERRRRIQLKLRSRLDRKHQARHGVLPPFTLHKEETVFVQRQVLKVDHVLDRGGPAPS